MLFHVRCEIDRGSGEAVALIPVDLDRAELGERHAGEAEHEQAEQNETRQHRAAQTGARVEGNDGDRAMHLHATFARPLVAPLSVAFSVVYFAFML